MLSESPVNNKCFNIIKGFIFDAALTDVYLRRSVVYIWGKLYLFVSFLYDYKKFENQKKRQQFAKNCITENYKIKLSMLYVLNTEVITENPVYLKYTAWLLGNEGKLCTMYKQINVYENEIWDTWPIKWNIWNERFINSKIFINKF